MEDLHFFVGQWLAHAEDPSTGRKFTLRYRVAPTLDGYWLAGSGESSEMGLKVQDLWGHDPVTGEIVRVIFDSQGTFGTVKSKGWEGGAGVGGQGSNEAGHPLGPRDDHAARSSGVQGSMGDAP